MARTSTVTETRPSVVIVGESSTAEPDQTSTSTSSTAARDSLSNAGRQKKAGAKRSRATRGTDSPDEGTSSSTGSIGQIGEVIRVTIEGLSAPPRLTGRAEPAADLSIAAQQRSASDSADVSLEPANVGTNPVAKATVGPAYLAEINAARSKTAISAGTSGEMVAKGAALGVHAGLVKNFVGLLADVLLDHYKFESLLKRTAIKSPMTGAAIGVAHYFMEICVKAMILKGIFGYEMGNVDPARAFPYDPEDVQYLKHVKNGERTAAPPLGVVAEAAIDRLIKVSLQRRIMLLQQRAHKVGKPWADILQILCVSSPSGLRGLLFHTDSAALTAAYSTVHSTIGGGLIGAVINGSAMAAGQGKGADRVWAHTIVKSKKTSVARVVGKMARLELPALTDVTGIPGVMIDAGFEAIEKTMINPNRGPLRQLFHDVSGRAVGGSYGVFLSDLTVKSIELLEPRDKWLLGALAMLGTMLYLFPLYACLPVNASRPKTERVPFTRTVRAGAAMNINLCDHSTHAVIGTDAGGWARVVRNVPARAIDIVHWPITGIIGMAAHLAFDVVELPMVSFALLRSDKTADSASDGRIV